MTDYLVYDVFTDRPFGGNQLAIVPNAAELPEARLQTIAREFNFSETVFLYPPEGEGVAKARIFNPSTELPFAGHPVIGTVVMLGEAGLGPDFILELGVGPMHVRAGDGRASFTNEVALERLAHPDAALVARALGTPGPTIMGQPVMASVGVAYTFTELVDRAALSDLVPDTTALREGAARYPGRVSFPQVAYVRDGGSIHMRMFAPLDGVPEDPATGSAAAALGALLCEADGAPLSLTIHQGEDMGRPSLIEVEAAPGRVTVSGSAVRVMEGKLVV
ncbi:PhzF family phenazine biosynthesis protein [Maritimibacter sp. UBA3975]|uniref:PhzF family phenazine biosynthesis protein n=1 Tax=Maritimibacter sp. UBA3975 TaxID=1946833 RepID=UPI000C09A1FC|nr:PhzF family phenazine biosynthesis protein [Maritimibacter sp. UBA3975]MAM60191.1 phenazine biosynthesis protein [Maritimibacter sp.]|tara:strand:- start:3266 stop:4096 length:831 start_codon:yes stop_codon:yes gene_type:complete